ncbi:MAG: hypothetical protein ACRYGK_10175 [Janthinobacterium lividum]
MIARHALPDEARALAQLASLPGLLRSPLTPPLLAQLTASLKVLHRQLLSIHLAQGKFARQSLSLPAFIDELIHASHAELGQFIQTRQGTGESVQPGIAALLQHARQTHALASQLYTGQLAKSAFCIERIGAAFLSEVAAATGVAMMKEMDYSPVHVITQLPQEERLTFLLSMCASIDEKMILSLAKHLRPFEIVDLGAMTTNFSGKKELSLSMAIIAFSKENILDARNLFSMAQESFAAAQVRVQGASTAYDYARQAYQANPLDATTITASAEAEIARNAAVQEAETLLANLSLARGRSHVLSAGSGTQQLSAAEKELETLAMLWRGNPFTAAEATGLITLGTEKIGELVVSLAKNLPYPTVEEFVQSFAQSALGQAGYILEWDNEQRLLEIVDENQAVHQAQCALEEAIARHAAQPGAESDAALQLAREGLAQALAPGAQGTGNPLTFETAMKAKASALAFCWLPQMLHANPEPAWSTMFHEQSLLEWTTLLLKLETQGLGALAAQEQQAYLAMINQVLAASDEFESQKKTLVATLASDFGKLVPGHNVDTALRLLQTFLAEMPEQGSNIFLRLLRTFPEIASVHTKVALLRQFEHRRDAQASVEQGIAVIRIIKYCQSAGINFTSNAHAQAYKQFVAGLAEATRTEKASAYQALLEEYPHLSHSRHFDINANEALAALMMTLVGSLFTTTLGGLAGILIGMAHSFAGNGNLFKDIGISAAVGSGIPGVVLTGAAVKVLKRPPSVHDAAFKALLGDLDVCSGLEANADQESSQAAAEALAEMAPLWQSVWHAFGGFDRRQKAGLLGLYIQQNFVVTARDHHRYGLDADDLDALLERLAPDETARNALLSVLPAFLPESPNKPLLHMGAARMLQCALAFASPAQKQRGQAAILAALDYQPAALTALLSPAQLRTRTSQKERDQAEAIRIQIVRDIGLEDEASRLEQGSYGIGGSDEYLAQEHLPLVVNRGMPRAGASRSSSSLSVVADGLARSLVTEPVEELFTIGSDAGSDESEDRP